MSASQVLKMRDHTSGGTVRGFRCTDIMYEVHEMAAKSLGFACQRVGVFTGIGIH